MKLYFVDPNDYFDSEATVLFDENGNQFWTFDTYHGELPSLSLLRKLGHEIEELDFADFVDVENTEPSGCTGEMPAHNEVLKKVKEYVRRR